MIENEDKPKPSSKEVVEPGPSTKEEPAKPERSAKEVANPELSSPKQIANSKETSKREPTAKATQEKSKKKTKKVPLSKKKSAKKSDKDKKEGNGHGKGGPKKDGVFSGITKCLACNEDFGNESRLRNHINKKHARDPMAECTICGRDFASEISCRQHRKHIHHKGMWQCRHCNLAYGKYVDCLNHELVHEIKSKKKRDKRLALIPGKPILQAENSERVKPRNSIIIKDETFSEEESSSEESSDEDSSEQDSDGSSTASDVSMDSLEDLTCLTIPAETERGTACMRCLSTEDDDGFLLCDHEGGPLHGGHFYCFGMTRVPKGDWFCPVHNMTHAVNKYMKGKKQPNRKKESKSKDKKKPKITTATAGDSKKSFMCFFCEKRFTTSGYLKRHMNRFHSDQKRVSDVSEDSPKPKKRKKKKKVKRDKVTEDDELFLKQLQTAEKRKKSKRGKDLKKAKRVKRTQKLPKTSKNAKSNKNKPKIIRSIPRNKPSARAEMLARLQEAEEEDSSDNSDDEVDADGMTARDRAHSDHVKSILEEVRLKKERAMEGEKNAAEELQNQLREIEMHLQSTQPPQPPQPPPLPVSAFHAPPPPMPPQQSPQFATANQPPRIFSQPIVSPTVIDKQQKPQWGFRPKKPAMPPPQNFQLPGSKPLTPHIWTPAASGSVPKSTPSSNWEDGPARQESSKNPVLDSWKSPPHSAPYEYRFPVEPSKNKQPSGWTVAEPTAPKNPPMIMHQRIEIKAEPTAPKNPPMMMNQRISSGEFDYRRENRGKEFYGRGRDSGYRRRSRSPKRRNQDRGRGRDRDRGKYSNPRQHNNSRDYGRRNDRGNTTNSLGWKRYENGQMKTSASSTVTSSYRARHSTDRFRAPGVIRRPIFTERSSRPPRPPSTILAKPSKRDFREQQLYQVKDDGGVEIL